MFNKTLDLIEKLDELLKTVDLSDNLNSKIIQLGTLFKLKCNSQYISLMPDNMPNQLESQFTNLHNYILSYKSNITNTPSNTINNIKNNIKLTIQAIVDIISKIPVFGEGETVEGVDNALYLLEQKNTEIITNIKNANSKYKSELDKLEEITKILRNEIAKVQEKTDSFFNEIQLQFSAAQEKRINDFTDQQNRILETANTGKDNIDATYKASLKQFETKTKQLITTLESSLAKALGDYSAKGDDLLESIQSIKARTEEIQKKVETKYGTIGADVLVGSQRICADKARKAAEWFFWFAVGFMILAFIAIAAPIWRIIILAENSYTVDLQFFLFRTITVLILLVPAIYLANEAKKQRLQEFKYRELEVKMTTMKPFFEDISDYSSAENKGLPDKDKVKLDLARLLLSPDKEADKGALKLKEINALIEQINKIISIASPRR